MIRLVIVLLLATAWLDSHAQSLPECSEEKPFYEWSGCVGTYTYPDGTQYVGGFASGENRGRGALISAKGYTLVDGRWLNETTVDVKGSQWRWVANSTDVHFFILISSIKQEGAFRRAWIMRSLTQPDAEKWLSGRTLSRFDCSNERTQLLQASFFSGVWGEGKILASDYEATNWSYVAPGTVFESVAKYVCGYKLGNK